MTTAAHRVLVVDDEPNIVDVVTMALRFQGFEVESAGTGADALAAVSSFRPDLIVLDVMLPDLDGFEVCRRLSAGAARVPSCSSPPATRTEDKVRGLTLGGDDYVTKPFSLEEVVARVRVDPASASGDEPDFGAALRRSRDGRGRPRSSAAGTSVDLSPTEYKLLRYLLLNSDRVVTGADPRSCVGVRLRWRRHRAWRPT